MNVSMCVLGFDMNVFLTVTDGQDSRRVLLGTSGLAVSLC